MIGGDFNADLSASCGFSKLISNSLLENDFVRRDSQFPPTIDYTYVNESLNHFSKIDFMLFNNVSVHNFKIFDPDIHFSDHLPLLLTCSANFNNVCNRDVLLNDDQNILQPRWDHADLLTYYNNSFVHLQPILFELSDLSASLDDGNEIISPNCVDIVYEKIIAALKLCAALAVPLRRTFLFQVLVVARVRLSER